jgi:hypothetical protein
MTKHLTPIDIRSLPDLMRLAEEVKATKTPRVLKKADEMVAILMPVGTATSRRKNEQKPKPITRHSNQPQEAGRIQHHLTLVTRNRKDFERIPDLRLYQEA